MALVLGPSNALAHTPPAEAGLPNPQDVHVLLVDDEQLSRLVVCNLLRKCEYKGEKAHLCVWAHVWVPGVSACSVVARKSLLLDD